MKCYLARMRSKESAPKRDSYTKILWSWLGAFSGIYFIIIISQWLHQGSAFNLYLIGSFGASAILVYGAPLAEYSQPRNLIGGHIICALIGITVHKYIPLDVAINGALAVSFSVVAMQITRTMHPPGGATALIGGIGSSQIHDLGYMFIIMPVMLSVFLLLIIALIINNLSANPERHYPLYWW